MCRRRHKHQLRHAHAVEMAREGVPLVVIQRQLGHAHLGVTSIYLQGIDNSEIINTVHARRPPGIPATAGLDATPSVPGPSVKAEHHAPSKHARPRRPRTTTGPAEASGPQRSPTHLHG
ncbi:MAG: tyrosine-type recombinase/integrase [Solirubrobacteraceae bacterium]